MKDHCVIMSWKEHLENIYFDLKSPISYAGPTKIYTYLKKEGRYKVGLHAIRRWLQDIDAYSLQRPLRYKFKTRRVIAQGIDALWDVDLADVSNLAKYNDGIRYLLVAIDVFSRYLWVEPLKNKFHQTIIDALRKIFKTGRKPKELRTDKGSEWKNKWVASFLTKQNIHHYVTYNVTHANYSERVIRTLKVLMFRYFTHKKTYHYLDVLKDIARNYNHRPHRSLHGRSPTEINKSNEAIVWQQLYMGTMKPKRQLSKLKLKVVKPFKFRKGDFVGISSNRHNFQRDYQQKWTEEIFRINARYLRQGIPVYKLVDYDNETIQGTFYQSELQRVSKRDVFKVDKILKRRKRKGVSEVFVSWLGYPKKFNTWVKETDLQAL